MLSSGRDPADAGGVLGAPATGGCACAEGVLPLVAGALAGAEDVDPLLRAGCAVSGSAFVPAVVRAALGATGDSALSLAQPAAATSTASEHRTRCDRVEDGPKPSMVLLPCAMALPIMMRCALHCRATRTVSCRPAYATECCAATPERRLNALVSSTRSNAD